MANTLLLGALAAGVAYFGFIKPAQARKRAGAEGGGGGGGGLPRILFSEGCEWEIPDAWWTDVGAHKFAGILENKLAGAETWPEKLELMKTPALNSHLVAHEVLQGETTSTCPLPAVDADVFNVIPGLTEKQELMNNLFAHMINHVEASLAAFAKSAGTKVQFPVPLDEEGA